MSRVAKSRRRFLAAAGALLAGSATFAQEKPQRRRLIDMIANDEPIEDAPLKPDPRNWDDTTITASWLGHSTVLINFFGMRIITDPILYDRVGLNVAGLFTLGPRRLVRAPLAFDDLPEIDLILLSHAHMDHLDTRSVSQFDRSVPLVMAPHTSDVVDPYGFATVYELDWGKYTLIGDLRVEALEVQHFGWRYPWEEDRSRGNPEGRSYNAYLLSRRGHHIVFGGDTAYHERFLSLRNRGIAIDLAMMPIGSYDPWIRNHANPEQALAMADQMGARYVLPMHWRTFIQSEEPMMEPIERLKIASALTPGRIALDGIGQTWVLGTASADTAPEGQPSIPGTSD